MRELNWNLPLTSSKNRDIHWGKSTLYCLHRGFDFFSSSGHQFLFSPSSDTHYKPLHQTNTQPRDCFAKGANGDDWSSPKNVQFVTTDNSVTQCLHLSAKYPMRILVAQNSFSVTKCSRRHATSNPPALPKPRPQKTNKRNPAYIPNAVLTEYELCLKANKGFYGTKWV